LRFSVIIIKLMSAATSEVVVDGGRSAATTSMDVDDLKFFISR